MLTVSKLSLRETVMPSFGIRYDVDCLIGEPKYLCPSEDWIRNEFTEDWNRFKQRYGLKWTRRRNCNHISLASRFVANECHARGAGDPDAGILMGDFWYLPEGAQDGHAILFAVIRTNQDQFNPAFRLIHYEEQTSRIIQLSPTEIASCFGYAC